MKGDRARYQANVRQEVARDTPVATAAATAVTAFRSRVPRSRSATPWTGIRLGVGRCALFHAIKTSLGLE
jgi:hypothetical protein